MTFSDLPQLKPINHKKNLNNSLITSIKNSKSMNNQKKTNKIRNSLIQLTQMIKMKTLTPSIYNTPFPKKSQPSNLQFLIMILTRTVHIRPECQSKQCHRHYRISSRRDLIQRRMNRIKKRMSRSKRRRRKVKRYQQFNHMIIMNQICQLLRKNKLHQLKNQITKRVAAIV